MAIFLSTLEHSSVPIQVREILSFTRGVTKKLVAKIGMVAEVKGAVLLSTCNRTELYLCSDGVLNPGKILCKAAEIDYAPFESAFENLADDKAVSHLMEVASGLRSRIVGEDQIIAQVKDAILISREEKCAGAELETLFRTAVSAGKEVRNRVRFSAVPTSAASRAVDFIGARMALSGRSAMVIGNGKMGRLAAEKLSEMGCNVTVTLRTYRHGETIVPRGCNAVAYEDRFVRMDGMDFVISATTSPHYTISKEDIAKLDSPPPYFIDLSIPRDIEPSVGELPGVQAFNVDDLTDYCADFSIPALAQEIIDLHTERFYRWLRYRDGMPAAEELKNAIFERILGTWELEEDLDAEQLLELTVDRTVDLITGGCAGQLTAETLRRCGEKIRQHTTASRKVI